jgi:hypothetical protein
MVKPLLEFDGSPRVKITRESHENTRGTFSPPIFIGNDS